MIISPHKKCRVTKCGMQRVEWLSLKWRTNDKSSQSENNSEWCSDSTVPKVFTGIV